MNIHVFMLIYFLITNATYVKVPIKSVLITHLAFNKYFDLNLSLNQQNLITFFKYQFVILSWKYYIISKFYNNKSVFSLDMIFNNLMTKYKSVHEEGKPSLLTKLREKDSSINLNMNLLLLNINKNTDNNYILELSDEYKSVYSEITPTNPISNLINKGIIYPEIKLKIGLAKLDKTDDDYDYNIFINIFYNSLAKADLSFKLGLIKTNKFLIIKNIANLREDGDEVSLIDVIIIKKYEYYCYDHSKKSIFSFWKIRANNRKSK